jgi:NAD(P)-dependent dehydrogenase (short-subunit alcohol dehydrogenase family)
MSDKVWFITGASKGFGREWAEAALERGDRVAATSRNAASLDPLVEKYGDAVLPIELDVRDEIAAGAAVRQAAEHFGSLDVVVNNAGYGLFGMVEEVTPEQVREQIETNLYGPYWITQAALPIMREQKSGHIVAVSSIAGLYALPGLGAYHASKFGLEGFTSSLALEVKGFGINVTLVEPAGYATDWAGPSSIHADRNPAYDDFRASNAPRPSAKRGDPAATRAAILAVVDSPTPPLRIFLGPAPLPVIRQEYAARISEWEAWNEVSEAAFGSA